MWIARWAARDGASAPGARDREHRAPTPTPRPHPHPQPKTELKNMNSFRFIERGINAEIARQTEIVEGGGAVEQETLHFDPRTERISSLRSKEEAHDYRYFPEPDLIPIAITQDMLDRARGA